MTSMLVFLELSSFGLGRLASATEYCPPSLGRGDGRLCRGDSVLTRDGAICC